LASPPALSGGEAQRIKLAYEISRNRAGQTLYILDEPTIGLSLYDTGRLLQLLDELVRKGSTVLVVEHDPAVLSSCDWIIELGPGGGNEGGRVIAQGSPEELHRNPASIIGPYLYG
jgi:excinuclease UvrABC ATPase subunit